MFSTELKSAGGAPPTWCVCDCRLGSPPTSPVSRASASVLRAAGVDRPGLRGSRSSSKADVTPNPPHPHPLLHFSLLECRWCATTWSDPSLRRPARGPKGGARPPSTRHSRPAPLLLRNVRLEHRAVGGGWARRLERHRRLCASTGGPPARPAPFPRARRLARIRRAPRCAGRLPEKARRFVGGRARARPAGSDPHRPPDTGPEGLGDQNPAGSARAFHSFLQRHRRRPSRRRGERLGLRRLGPCLGPRERQGPRPGVSPARGCSLAGHAVRPAAQPTKPRLHWLGPWLDPDGLRRGGRRRSALGRPPRP